MSETIENKPVTGEVVERVPGLTDLTPDKNRSQSVCIKNKERFLAFYNDVKNGCHISNTCRYTGISRQTYYDWRQNDDDFAQACEDAEESLVDWLEAQLYLQAQDGNVAGIIFALCNKGRRRGWQQTARIQQQVITKLGVKIEYVEPDGNSSDSTPGNANGEGPPKALPIPAE